MVNWENLAAAVAICVLGAIFLPQLLNAFKEMNNALTGLLGQNLERINTTLSTLKDINERQERSQTIMLEDMQQRLHRIEQLLLLHLHAQQETSQAAQKPGVSGVEQD